MSLPSITSLKKKRLLLGMTQSGFATLCGISQSLVAKIEAGRVDPSYSIATRIFEALERLESRHAEKIGRNLVAKDVMTKRVVSVRPSDILAKAAEIMLKNNFSQLPVLDAKANNVGSITERMIIAASGYTMNSINREATVELVMSCPFPVINLQTNLSTIRNILLEEPAVLVFGDTGVGIIGIVTKFDLIRATEARR